MKKIINKINLFFLIKNIFFAIGILWVIVVIIIALYYKVPDDLGIGEEWFK